MRRIALLLLTLLACGLANAQEAQPDPPAKQQVGRWGVRLEYPLEAVAFVEVVAFNLADLEVGTGVEAKFESGDPLGQPMMVTPYTVVAWYGKSYWLAVEAAIPVDLLGQRVGFGAAVSAGGRF